MGATIMLAIGLLLVGLLLVVIECMIPSFGIIGITGGAALIAAIILGFQAGGMTSGIMFLLCSVAGVPFAIHLGFKLLPKTPFGKGFIVDGPESVSEQTVEAGYDHLEGKEGVAKTMLRPSGIALIENERVTVQTEGTILEKNTRIKVVKVVGNKIFVESV